MRRRIAESALEPAWRFAPSTRKEPERPETQAPIWCARNEGQGGRGCKSAGREPAPQRLPPACKTALDRPHRAGKLLRSFLGRHAFEKAQDEDVPKLGRKLAELSIQDGPQFERFVLAVRRRGDVGGHGSQTPPPLQSRARALVATRVATPYNHGPSRSESRICPALRTNTRNVAWNASSAS